MPERQRAFIPLLHMHLLQLRGEFIPLLMASLVLPVGMVTALANISGLDAAQRALLLASSGLLAPLGVALLVVPGYLARLRDQGQIRFFAALPVERGELLGSWFVAFLLASLPGAVAAPWWGAHLLHIVFPFAVGLVPIWLLAAGALLALGGSLGLAGLRHTAALACGFVGYAASLVGLLFLALPHMATLAHTIGWLLPASLGGDLAAAALPHSSGHLVITDILLLVLYNTVFAYLAYRLLPWRVESKVPAPATIPLP